MNKGYWIVRVNVTDQKKYDDYRDMVDEPLRKFGGRFLVRGGSFEIKEGTARPRNVIIEFPSYEAALDCYGSPEYQRAKARRMGGAEFDLIVINGYDGKQP